MTFKASAHHLSLNQLDDWIKLIRRRCLHVGALRSNVEMGQQRASSETLRPSDFERLLVPFFLRQEVSSVMFWNKNQVWQVHGGQNLDAPIAGPPPSFMLDRMRARRRRWLLSAAVLNLSVLLFCVTTVNRRAAGQNHDVPAATSVVQVPAVELPAEPGTLVQAPKPKLQAEPAPVVQAPAIEPKAEPAPVVQAPAVEPEPMPRRRDRIFAVEPEPKPKPEPVRVAQAPAVEPESRQGNKVRTLEEDVDPLLAQARVPARSCRGKGW